MARNDIIEGIHGVGFHCVRTKAERRRLVSEGYRAPRPAPVYYFELYPEAFSAMLPQSVINRVERLFARAEETGNPEPAFISLRKEWTRRFPGGIIWIVPVRPPPEVYGPYCVLLKVPDDASLIVEDETRGEGWYSPTGFVPPEFVRMIA